MVRAAGLEAVLTGTETESPDPRGRARLGQRLRRFWLAAGGLLATAGLFYCYLRVSRTQQVESDGASAALQAWDMLHGNLLLHGWVIPDVTFYLIELPEYMFTELLRGLSADAVHVAAAMTYTLAVVLAALLARGRSAGREAVVRMAVAAGIMLAPQPGPGVFIVLFQPDHFGTQMALLLAWLVLDRAWPGRGWLLAPALIAVLLTWVGISDQIVLLTGVIPLALAGAARAARIVVRHRADGLAAAIRLARYELALVVAALAAEAAARTAVKLISLGGGYRMLPLGAGVIRLRQLPWHLRLWAQGVLGLYGASFAVRPGLAWVFAALHLAGLALAAWGLWLTARRFWCCGDIVAQVLAAGIVVNTLAYLASTRPTAYWGTREIAGLLAMGAVLAGRMAGPRLSAARAPGKLLRGALAAVLAGYLAALGWAVTLPPARADAQGLANWLGAHHARYGLTRYGLGSYGSSNATTLAGRGEVGIRPVVATRAGISPGAHEFNLAWYNPHRHYTNFAVVRIVRGDDDPVSEAELRRAFGRPARQYHAGRYLIVAWNKNLLPDLGPPAPH